RRRTEPPWPPTLAASARRRRARSTRAARGVGRGRGPNHASLAGGSRRWAAGRRARSEATRGFDARARRTARSAGADALDGGDLLLRQIDLVRGEVLRHV